MFMLLFQVTSVGVNTEWGLLMASISEDTGEETPLQVSFVLSFTMPFYTVIFTYNVFVGTFKWGCNFHRYGWTYSSLCRLGCPFG